MTGRIEASRPAPALSSASDREYCAIFSRERSPPSRVCDVKSDSLLNVHERACTVRFDHDDTEMHLLLLRSLFREMISDLAGARTTAEELNRGGMTRYLIVVARTEPAVYEHLRNRHHADPKVRVMLDRRGAIEYESSDSPPPLPPREPSSLVRMLDV